MNAITVGMIAVSLTIGAAVAARSSAPRFDRTEMEVLRSLSLDALDALPRDPSNQYADNAAAAALGRKFFFETSFSANGKVSCATCHVPDRQFQDGTDLAQGVGTTNRRTMPIAGTAHSPWMFWDGRKDSQWAQALGPLESPVEHGGTRGQYVRIVAARYADEYRAVFGDADWSDTTRVFVNIGKAIAAYERKLQFGRARYDEYVASGTGLTDDELHGAKLFIGKANCVQCHNGALFTDNVFHNTGVPARKDLPADDGRATGARAVLADEFNCRSKWSDAKKGECGELEFLVAEGHELERAFKTPTLRGVASRPPYMHAGQIKTLEDVLDHYNRAPKAPAGHSEVKPLKLSKRELQQIAAFLRTLESPVIEGK
jgi:cytochrome c peroxidase